MDIRSRDEYPNTVYLVSYFTNRDRLILKFLRQILLLHQRLQLLFLVK
mgnify:CR=1 FL=1